MEPRIVTLEAMPVIGVMHGGYDAPDMIPELWDAFAERAAEIAHPARPEVFLGVSFDWCEDGAFSYLAGCQVRAASAVPPGLSRLVIPSATYAVFTHRGPLFDAACGLPATYAYIYEYWLPASGFVHPGTPIFEWYDHRFRLQQPDSEVDIYIPIRRETVRMMDFSRGNILSLLGV